MKKYGKHILPLALALVTILSLFSVTASAANYTVVEVIPCKYDWAQDFSEGFARVRLDGKYGFIDRTGKEIAPCKYSGVEDFSEGLAAVMGDSGEKDALGGTIDKWGFIDTTGKEIIPFKYNPKHASGPEFHEGLAAVGVRSGENSKYGGPIYKYGFIDKTGKEVVPCKYDDVKNFSEGLAAVRMGNRESGKWGFVDKTGKEVIPCKYSRVGNFSEGLASVEVGEGLYSEGLWGFIDTTGKEVIACQYGFAGDFSEGLVQVMLDDKYGFIDKAGQVVIPFQYDGVWGFDQGLAGVCVGDSYMGGKWSYIDKAGREVISCEYKYDRVGSFSEGRAQVIIGEAPIEGDAQYGFIDPSGQEVIPPKYHDARYFSEGLSAVGICGPNAMWYSGFIDKAGNEVVPLAYEETRSFHEGLAAVRRGGKWGYISILATPTAYASTQTVNVDGRDMTFDCYALKDKSGNMTNYIKLRDLAILLNGSAAQFQVGWDGNVTITTGTAYTPNGTELRTPYSGDRTCREAAATTAVNGQAVDLAAFTLQDDTGGGYTYYQLRDLGKALGFNVGWSADRGVFLETDKPYDPAN